MKSRIMKLVAIGLTVCIGVAGCMPSTRSKQSVPDATYTKAGYAVVGQVEGDGTVVLTYGLIGVKDEKINYLYIDQVEQNPKTDRHLFTNRELDSAYGLSYESDDGEWCDQVNVLTNYIAGNGLTIEEVNAIPVYQKDSENPMVPKSGTDLAAGCKLDISVFIEVINKAYENLEEMDIDRLAVGDDVRVSNKNGRLDLTLAFVGTDYRYKINFCHLETYSITADPGEEVLSQREKNVQPWASGEAAFEEYIKGLNMEEAAGVETYDPGDGVNLALPKKGTDLAEICDIDLSKFVLTLKEAAKKL